MKTIPSAVLSMLLAIAACPLHARVEAPDRAAFARAMAAVTAGMKPDEVARLIGKPGDLRTRFDPGGITTSRTTEIWCYGTAGHLTFPTLGCVFMDRNGAQYIFGGKGSPPAATMFREEELANLLQLIDSASADDGRNPLNYLRIVNTLQPLGKDKALAAIDEYHRVSPDFLSDPIPLFLVLRLLFEVPADPGFMPAMIVGAPSVAAPKDPKLLPLFPLVLIDEVPLNLVHGYMLGGMRQPVTEHLEYFRKHGRLRQRPLVPSDHPLAVLARLEHSPQWIFEEPSAWDKGLLAEQLLRLIDTVYRVKPDQDGHLMPQQQFDPDRWDKFARDVAALQIKWDPANNSYVFADGSSLPEVKKPMYMRRIWEIPGLGPGADLILERRNKDCVLLRLERSESPGIKVPASVVKVYRTGENPHPLAEFKIPASAGGNLSQQTSQDIRLPAGESVQAEITTGKNTTHSEPMTP